MIQKQRYEAVIAYFKKHAPNAQTELAYTNAYELLVAVILSAQCTDKRINLTTPAIFKAYPTVKKLASADFEALFPLIKSISYPSNKTKHLIGMAQLVMEKFKGEIPMTVEELVLLPGVGRKTANVITSVMDDQPNMAVDTHVFRVSARIGLTLKATTVLAAEKQLIKHFPQSLIYQAHHWLILHGRYVCTARSPKCSDCGLKAVCKLYNAKKTKAATTIA